MISSLLSPPKYHVFFIFPLICAHRLSFFCVGIKNIWEDTFLFGRCVSPVPPHFFSIWEFRIFFLGSIVQSPSAQETRRRSTVTDTGSGGSAQAVPPHSEGTPRGSSLDAWSWDPLPHLSSLDTRARERHAGAGGGLVRLFGCQRLRSPRSLRKAPPLFLIPR